MAIKKGRRVKTLLSTAVFLAVIFAQSALAVEKQLGLITIQASEGSEEIVLDIDALNALEQIEFTTSTIWFEGEAEFSGPSLSDVLQEIGRTGTSLEMTALNDYSVTMPVSEIGDQYPIVALRMNGKPMPVREKGPYWVMYPFDSFDEFQNETVYSRSIWQLTALTLR